MRVAAASGGSRGRKESIGPQSRPAQLAHNTSQWCGSCLRVRQEERAGGAHLGVHEEESIVLHLSCGLLRDKNSRAQIQAIREGGREADLSRSAKHMDGMSQQSSRGRPEREERI